ncbi:hypothetical protein BDV12DRAFT_206470 [Aspergillus spectabilis]
MEAALTIEAHRGTAPPPSPEELFHYLPLHQVLICLHCRYAMQPRAVTRHLTEIHHLNHSQRKPFLDYIARFPLADPKDVILPSECQFPVPFLPVLSGVACRFPGCGHLCVTTKRMEHHWASMHQTTDRSSWSWLPVSLQTFFRGNALRYFTNPSLIVRPPAASAENNTDEELLRHYVRSTYLTLCSDIKMEHAFKALVPQLAREFPFLMHGILACSALHLAHGDPSHRSHYICQALDHQELAMPHYRSAISYVTDQNSGAILVFAFVLVICALALEDEDGNSLFLFPTGSAGLDADIQDANSSAIYLLRAGCSMLWDTWEKIQSSPLSVLAELWELESAQSAPVKLDTDPFLHRLLSMIPNSSCASDVAWSESEIDVYRSAAILLTEAVTIGHQEGVAFTIWGALTIWPLRVPDEYLRLVRVDHPGALFLLAHYMSLLHLLKASWFFEGCVQRALNEIGVRLQGPNTSIEMRQAFLELRLECQ